MADSQQLMVIPGMVTKPLKGGVTLPSLSPLAGRKVKPTIAINDLKEGLNAFGYEVGWDSGSIQVTPPGTTKSPTSAPATFNVETFMGAQHRERHLGLGRSGRPRVASSVTFSTAKSPHPGGSSSKTGPHGAFPHPHPTSASTPTSPAGWKPHNTYSYLSDPPSTPPGTSRFAHAQGGGPAVLRPFTAPHQIHQQHAAEQQNGGAGVEAAKAGGGVLNAAAAAAAATSPSSVQGPGHPASNGARPTATMDTSPSALQSNNGPARFRRLAQSVDSLYSLKVANRGGLNLANLQALNEPHWAPSFNSTSPLIPQGPLLDAYTPATQQQQQQVEGTQCLHEPGEEGVEELGEGEGAGEWDADGRWIPSVRNTDGEGPPLPQQPRMPATMPLPVQDIQEGAVASLVAAKQAAANGEVHSAQRPFTARVGNNTGFRPRMAHPMACFKPSRAHTLQVFQHLDKDKNGKVTMAEIEDAGLGLGFTLEQTHRLFKRMDKSNKGFLRASDWGDKEFVKVVEFFSLMYMQKYMGLPTQASTPEQVGKYWASQELRQVKSMPAAITMARTNAVMRASNAANYNEFILNCFKFVDTEQRGSLTLEGVKDGFFALGVQVTEDVAKQIMSKCGTDASGNLNYQECVHRLFGNSTVF